ncbi:esterase [Pontibacter sp. 172403-2]|uniref:alpha/beta hydrolase n=1 Tax=Pontibacter rufus TaxID=2791028 RepID=UPI0018AF7C72|nr:alpha/beta hydrolase-fold protein [Pontibacter sp. 172403-2]MBF9255023.1 esterase [Pontibacter sp. 172403-2]
MESQQTNVAESDLVLKYLVRPAVAGVEKQKALILLHGVGSNEQDLMSLAPYIPENFTVISPRGPFVLGEKRFAWYQVGFSTGKPEINAAQESQSRNIIQEFVAQVKAKYNLDEVYLGGFSQGAIMSYTIGLTQPELVSGVIAFSGRILEEIRPLVTDTDKLKNLNVLIAHGTQDGTLPVHYAREAKVFLEGKGITPDYHELNMGHQITGELIVDVRDWLKNLT